MEGVWGIDECHCQLCFEALTPLTTPALNSRQGKSRNQDSSGSNPLCPSSPPSRQHSCSCTPPAPLPLLPRLFILVVKSVRRCIGKPWSEKLTLLLDLARRWVLPACICLCAHVPARARAHAHTHTHPDELMWETSSLVKVITILWPSLLSPFWSAGTEGFPGYIFSCSIKIRLKSMQLFPGLPGRTLARRICRHWLFACLTLRKALHLLQNLPWAQQGWGALPGLPSLLSSATCTDIS